MQSPSKKKLAILFDEGEHKTGELNGYLWVKELKKGMQGEAMIVKSVADGRLYVRKCLQSLIGQDGLIDDVPREIYVDEKLTQLEQSPPQCFPRVISHTLSETKPDASIIFQYCNGGDLSDLVEDYGERGPPIPEAVIWHVLVTLSKAIAYLHYGWQPNGSPVPGWQAILHNDINISNVFLHYSQDLKLPEVYLGDFGLAESPEESDPMQLQEHSSYDQARIGSWLPDLLMSHLKDQDGKHSKWTEHVHPSYSSELRSWVYQLEPPDGAPPPSSLEMVDKILPVAQRHINEAVARGQDISTRFRKPEEPDGAKLISGTHRAAETPDLTEPWNYVVVSSNGGDVLRFYSGKKVAVKVAASTRWGAEMTSKGLE